MRKLRNTLCIYTEIIYVRFTKQEEKLTEMTKQIENTIQELLLSYFERHDIDTVLSFVSEDVGYYANDEGEMVVGKDAARNRMEVDLQFLTVAYKVKHIKTHVLPLGENICSALTDCLVSNDVEEGEVSCHMSTTMVREKEEWKLKTVHLSYSREQERGMFQRMKQTMERYNAAIADTDISIWYYDMKKKCIIQSGHCLDIHGFQPVVENVPESLIQNNYLYEDSIAPFREMYDKLFAGASKVTGDFWVKTENKDSYWCERITYTTVYDEAGMPIMALGASKDVTLEKESERRYKEQESLRVALRENDIGRFYLNLTQNTIDAYREREDGSSLVENIKTVDEFFTQCRSIVTYILSDEIKIDEVFNRETLLKDFQDTEKTISFDTEVPKSETEICLVRWTIRILKNPQNGDFMAFILATDITQEGSMQILMGEVTHTDYEKLAIVDLDTEEAIVYEDADMKRSNYDSSIREQFEKQGQIISKLSLETVLKELEKKEIYEYIAKFEIDGKTSYKNWRFWYQSRSRKKMIAVKSDITSLMEEHDKQKKLLEDALKQAELMSEAKGSFLSNMSHEIRTPLNAMIGYLAIAKDSSDNPNKINHCIQNCDVASKHLLQIINDILDMSSIESGKLKIAHETFDLKKELMDLTTIFYQNAKDKNVTFESHIDNLTNEWVIGDQLRLQQILMNLLSNAVKFTPEQGMVRLSVHQFDEDEKKVFLKFIVKDTGIGMSKEYLSRIFQPFEQENAGTAKKYGGSGLGLSITNNLVRMMGGNITVESEQNQGTTFTVTMYFDKTKVKSEPENAFSDYSHIRVLVVDDNKDECSYIQTMLKHLGVKSDAVNDGQTAIKRLKSRLGSDYEYGLCIIDWKMPGMTGTEVTRRIREDIEKDIPIIVATAYDTSEVIDEAKEAGVNRVISKPLFQSTLFDLLVSLFGKYTPKRKNIQAENKIDFRGVRVLLAEDNEMNMDIAVTMIEKVGITVD